MNPLTREYVGMATGGMEIVMHYAPGHVITAKVLSCVVDRLVKWILLASELVKELGSRSILNDL